MTSTTEWTQELLQNMIDSNTEESVYLDFKASGALVGDKKKDIAKDVSAFANSDGGVIVYGMNEVDHKADSFSFIDGSVITKEWLEQIIKDGIHRRVDGIRIHPIRIDDDIKKTVYVVEVPVSPLAPHMIKDNRYYKRFNFMSVPMEEYEVRNVFERAQNVKLEFAATTITLQSESLGSKSGQIWFDISFNIKNIGHAVADYYKLLCVINGAEESEFTWERSAHYHATRLEDGTYTISNSMSIPVFPDEEINVLNMALAIPMSRVTNVLDSMQMKLILYTQGSKVEKSLEVKSDMYQQIKEAIQRINAVPRK